MEWVVTREGREESISSHAPFFGWKWCVMSSQNFNNGRAWYDFSATNRVPGPGGNIFGQLWQLKSETKNNRQTTQAARPAMKAQWFSRYGWRERVERVSKKVIIRLNDFRWSFCFCSGRFCFVLFGCTIDFGHSLEFGWGVFALSFLTC